MADLNIEDVKRDFKNTIEELVNSNQIPEAKYMINEYEKRVVADADIFSMKAVIAIMEGKLDEAGKSINYGLRLDPLNCELYYNLAYLYELKNDYICAYREYWKLSKICNAELLQAVNLRLLECEKQKIVEDYKKRKKVLIVAYIFPPLGGSGVQRTLKFTKYLRQFGWEPIVVTVGKSNFYFKDDTMLSEVPKDIEVIRIEGINNIDNRHINELISLYRGIVQDNTLMTEYIQELQKSNENLKRFIFIPEQYIVWAKEVLDKVSQEVDFDDIDLIYTTSGPYSDHIIGYYLKRKYQKSWVADFRDEWTNNPYFQTIDRKHIVYKIQRKMESNILKYADKVITVTRLSTENYINGFNLNSDKVMTITNGYDEDDFKNLDLQQQNNGKFTIVHNGIFYMIRTPETFLAAIKNLLHKNLIRKEDLQIIFTCIDNEEYWRRYVTELKLDKIVVFNGYLSHKDSLNVVSKADVLLLVVGPGEKNKSVYTGKVFEYLRLRKSILALSPIGSLVDELISVTKRGKNVDFNDIEGIEQYILQMYKKWREGSLKNLEITNEIKKYERKELTTHLSQVFDAVCNSQVSLNNDTSGYDRTEKDNQFYNEVYSTGGVESNIF